MKNFNHSVDFVLRVYNGARAKWHGLKFFMVSNKTNIDTSLFSLNNIFDWLLKPIFVKAISQSKQMKKKTLDLNKTVDDIVQVICTACKNTTRHKVISSADEAGDDSEDDENYWYCWNVSYQIIKCEGCGSISFRSEHSNSEDRDYEDGTPRISDLVYPKRSLDTWNTRKFFNAPFQLYRIYRETIDCYNNENLTLCGAGVRALVEGLCNENNILDGEVEYTKRDGSIIKKRLTNLQGKINGLSEKGIILKEHAACLHEHRFLGNDSVHDLSAPPKEDLRLALEIIEHVFESLYEIPQKGMQLKIKRLRKKK